MTARQDQARAVLEALRELRQRLEGAVPFEQAGQVQSLFAAAEGAARSLADPGTGLSAGSAQQALAALEALQHLTLAGIPAGQRDYLAALFESAAAPLRALARA
jgi:hypothetical protein